MHRTSNELAPLARGPLVRSPLHELHVRYHAPLAETRRDVMYMTDLSLSAKFSLLGKHVADFVAARFPDSAVAKTRGAALALGPPSVLACRPSRDQLLLQADSLENDSSLDRWIGDLPENMDLLRVNMTSALASISLVGPGIEDLLRRLTAFDVCERNFPLNSCAETNLAGVQALLVRLAKFGVPSVQILVSWDLCEYLWETLADAGQPFGMTAVFWDAWRMLQKRTE